MAPLATVKSGSLCQEWIIHHLAVTDSTNLAAAKLSAWHAVRADTQRKGRGRFERAWVSDRGGLWLSAVVPVGSAPGWQALPLAVGLSVCQVLRALGVGELRMRWPNDILVGEKKLAGLLIEQFIPGLAVAGIGINVSNQPEKHNAVLKNQTARLADLIHVAPVLKDLTGLLLDELRATVQQIETDGFASLIPAINELWGEPRRVELDLDGRLCAGIFSRVGTAGELELLDDAGQLVSYHAHQVRHLKELS